MGLIQIFRCCIRYYLTGCCCISLSVDPSSLVWCLDGGVLWYQDTHMSNISVSWCHYNFMVLMIHSWQVVLPLYMLSYNIIDSTTDCAPQFVMYISWHILGVKFFCNCLLYCLGFIALRLDVAILSFSASIILVGRDLSNSNNYPYSMKRSILKINH